MSLRILVKSAVQRLLESLRRVHRWLPVPNRGSPWARHRRLDLTRHSKECLQAQRQNQAQRQILLAQRCVTTQRKILQTSVLGYRADFGWDVSRLNTPPTSIATPGCHEGEKSLRRTVGRGRELVIYIKNPSKYTVTFKHYATQWFAF